MKKIAAQRRCLALLILCYAGYALHRYSTERVVDLLVTQIILNEPSIPINAGQISTYVINLDSTPERYSALKSQLDKLNIKHSRFRAVNGYDVKITDDEQKEFHGRDIKSHKLSFIASKHYTISCPSCDLAYTNTRYTFSAGEFGAYCSHLEVWQDIVKRNTKYALVLEDDVRLPNNFNYLFNTILSNAPSNWDVIYLYLTPTASFKKFTSIVNKPYLKVNQNMEHVFSAAAYLLSYEGAKKLLENSTNISEPIDAQISMLINLNKIHAYKSSENLVITPPRVAENSITFQMGRPMY